MKKYLYDYIEEIDKLLKSNNKITEKTINNHLIKIGFFQHERQIHLYVTLFYVLLFLLFAGLGLIHFIFCIITVILLIFNLFYIVHYFRLENGVQYLYKQYDFMMEKNKKDIIIKIEN